MEKWEYKTVTFEAKGFMGGTLDTDNFDEKLNEQGRQGWEVVSCFDTNYAQGGTRYVYVLMKRRVV